RRARIGDEEPPPGAARQRAGLRPPQRLAGARVLPGLRLGHPALVAPVGTQAAVEGPVGGARRIRFPVVADLVVVRRGADHALEVLRQLAMRPLTRTELLVRAAVAIVQARRLQQAVGGI